jgi:hypothetical protein
VTQTHDRLDTDMNTHGEPDSGEDEASAPDMDQRDEFFLSPAEAAEDFHPSLYNLSAGMIFDAVIRPVAPQPPDYVTLPMGRSAQLAAQVGQWNMLWEAGQFRRRFFDAEELPPPMAKIADLGDVNVILVPRTQSRYFEYAPLFHLLPTATLQRFGLPLLRRGQWPFLADYAGTDRYLPPTFAKSLAQAWAATVWPHLNSGSRMSAFSADDPIRLLAHNLDFWLPAVTSVIQARLGEFPVVDPGRAVGPVPLADGSVLEGALTGGPRMGGPVWEGVADAAEVVAETVEAADATGRLRAIMEAVRTHRVDDDFSAQWSYAREDFERKLHRKRSKVAVRFVELTDTIPVQGPEADVLDRQVTSHFLALLDARQRQIVILLSSGFRQHEIAEQLGYANHSPVAKRLAEIRRQAAAFFDLQDR